MKLTEKQLHTAWLHMTDAADKVFVHGENIEHNIVGILAVVDQIVMRKGYALGKQLAANAVHLLFQNSTFHCVGWKLDE